MAILKLNRTRFVKIMKKIKNNNNIHDWKLIPLHIITQKLGKNYLFHCEAYISPKKIRQFPKYHQ